MTQSRICKHLTHPREAYTIGARIGAAMVPADPLEIDLCTWHTSAIPGPAPPAFVRRVGGGIDLNDGDCDICPCFQPIEAPPIPKSKNPGRAAGGYARAAKLSPKTRSEIARKAANKRWKKP